MGVKRREDNRLFSDCTIAMLDVETTGLCPIDDRVTEVALTAMDPYGEVIASCSWLCNPGKPISEEVALLTGITNEMVMDAPTFGQIAAGLMDLMPEGSIPAAYNARFDRGMLTAEWARLGRPAPPFLHPDVDFVDPMVWAKVYEPYARGVGRYKLENVAKRLGIEVLSAHRALVDTESAARVLRELQPFRQNKKMPIFTEEPTVNRLLMKQKIFQAKQEADFLGWLIEQPPRVEE
jgi:DNA polymerase III epsilon subunit family exonuclease